MSTFGTPRLVLYDAKTCYIFDFNNYYLGLGGQFCSKYRGETSKLPDNCEFCSDKNTFVDGEVAGLYGYTSLVLPKATLIVGNRTFRNQEAKPNYTYLDSKARYGLLPDEVEPALYDDPEGKNQNRVF